METNVQETARAVLPLLPDMLGTRGDGRAYLHSLSSSQKEAMMPGFYDHHIVLWIYHKAGFRCGCDECLIELLRR